MKKIESLEIKTIVKSELEGEDLKNKLNELFKSKSSIFSILGFDIYKYSKYKSLEQSLIPYIFKKIYKETIHHCLEYEKFIFQKYEKENNFTDRLIDTGDGGFQIFNNPIEAFVFAVYFQANLRRFNSFGSNEKLRDIIGEITLRYALTTDLLFKFENNYYGPAIINNARIMSKDKLNRFLLDDSTIKWFDKHIKGIENLQTLNPSDFEQIKCFSVYVKDKETKPSLIFPDIKNTRLILKSDILRIGEIEAKGDSFAVYNFHSQILLYSSEEPGFNRYTITLGNLNASGLD